MATTVDRPVESKYSPEEICNISKEYHDQFLKFNILINQCAKLENPALRIHDFNILLKKIDKFHLEINQTHTKIKPNDATPPLDLTTNEDYLDNLQDLLNPNYELYQMKLNSSFRQKIEHEILKAKEENIFDSTFYVYQDARGNETNKRQSAVQYFLGVPRKDQSKFFYVLDWLSYIGGGFLIIPLKNLLKVFIEYLPNLLATRVDIHLSKMADQNPPPSSLDIIGNWLLYSILKPIHWVGRAITSPITSAKAGFAYGRELGNSVNSKPLGVLLGILFALPSLATGITAVILTILFAPPSIIWVIGKLPWVGVEAAAWLTSTGMTLGGLNGLSATMTSNSLAVVSRVAPSIATEAGAGISAFSQFVLLGQKALALLGFTRFLEKPKTDDDTIPPPPPALKEIPYTYKQSYRMLSNHGLISQESVSDAKDIVTVDLEILQPTHSVVPTNSLMTQSDAGTGAKTTTQVTKTGDLQELSDNDQLMGRRTPLKM